MERVIQKNSEFAAIQTKEIENSKKLAAMYRMIPKMMNSLNAQKRKGSRGPLRETIERLFDTLGEETLRKAFSKPRADEGKNDCSITKARDEINDKTEEKDEQDSLLYPIAIMVEDYNDETNMLSYYNRRNGKNILVNFHTIQTYISKCKNNPTAS